MQAATSWGRLRSEPCDWQRLDERRTVAASIGRSKTPGLAYGNGRSYGDVCLNDGGTLWSTRGLDRFIAFDPATGELECEAGVLLDAIIDVALPAGWFLPVTPGTRFVSVGGAIANDVHGKNHHRAGTFGEHVESLWLARTDGSRLRCARDENADWLAATIGGLGLTGVIESARLRLRRVAGEWIDATSQSFDTLARFHELSAEAERESEYGVAWIDCAAPRGRARGVFFRGDHAAAGAAGVSAPPPKRRRVPIELPVSLVNGWSVRLFNAAYRARHRGTRRRLQHHRSFFYPLDEVLDWNRIYGSRGFYQYQCVVPRANEVDATNELLLAIGASGQGSFLAVLKTFGERQAAGLLSFPMAGTTLALDFPDRGSATLALFERLDRIVLAAGGRLYPAKDARMSASLFQATYPRWPELERFRDPGIASDLSRRLFGR